MTNRDEAIAEFNARAAFEATARQAFESVLARNPLTLMFVYEHLSGQVALTTVPFSPQLARGLTDAAYSMMWIQPEAEGGETNEEPVDED